MAVQNYSDAHMDSLPVAATGKDGRPLLSWRVMILPYLEEDALFREFHLDEPWDSPHNVRLLDRMPKVYQPFRGKKDNPPNTTPYRVFVGKNTPFGEAVSLKEISSARGPSNTIMAVESAEPVPWTKPDELDFNLNEPLPKLGLTEDQVFVAFFNGSVEHLPKPIDETKFRKMIQLRDE